MTDEKVEISEEARKKIEESKKTEKIKVKIVDSKKESSTKKSEKKSDELKKLKKKMEELQEKIRTLEKENKELEDKALRRLAELENYRKRVEKTMKEYAYKKVGEFIYELLNVVDNFERAIEHTTEDEKQGSLYEGVKLIHKQLKELLSNHQVEEIDTSNKKFDPYIHQALDRVETEEDIEHPEIVHVYQKGYKYQGKVLRPSLVRVKVKKEKKDDKPEQKEEKNDMEG